MASLIGPAATWGLNRLGPAGRWVRQQARRDHAPIASRHMLPVHGYDAYSLFVAVGPSDSARPRSLIDFIDAAHAFVRSGLAEIFTEPPDYSGPELVRYVQPLDQSPSGPEHIIYVYPSGLVELKWVLALPPATALPLDQISGVIGLLHRLIASDVYPGVYRGRRFEKLRRVDWRIGINGSATLKDGSGSGYWTDLVSPVALPTERVAIPRPTCPRDGYAAGHLTSIRRSAQLTPLLVPVMEDLLLSAGYTNKAEIQDCASEMATIPGRVGRK